VGGTARLVVSSARASEHTVRGMPGEHGEGSHSGDRGRSMERRLVRLTDGECPNTCESRCGVRCWWSPSTTTLLANGTREVPLSVHAVADVHRELLLKRKAAARQLLASRAAWWVMGARV
jgi:hypothetical protein